MRRKKTPAHYARFDVKKIKALNVECDDINIAAILLNFLRNNQRKNLLLAQRFIQLHHLIKCVSSQEFIKLLSMELICCLLSLHQRCLLHLLLVHNKQN